MGETCVTRVRGWWIGAAVRNRALVLGVLVSGAMLGSCAGKASTADGAGGAGSPMGGSAGSANAGTLAAVNDRCPIMDEHPVSKRTDPDLTRRFKGELVGFCCDDCPGAWDALSDQEKSAALAKVRRR
ncbi:MAG: hypothetical protein ACK55O_04495 [Phycisphaerales bacterium]|jgi:hypothetical protein|nr:hypothetical protein [Phycisphaeraceae bacterium]